MESIRKGGVDQLEPCGGDAVLWDSVIPGFGLRCRVSGAKYYCLKFRAPGGRQRWMTIGQHGAPWTPDAARREAKRLLGEVAKRRDPAETKAREKECETVSLRTRRIGFYKWPRLMPGSTRIYR